jgi:hypothetical protein
LPTLPLDKERAFKQQQQLSSQEKGGLENNPNTAEQSSKSNISALFAHIQPSPYLYNLFAIVNSGRFLRLRLELSHHSTTSRDGSERRSIGVQRHHSGWSVVSLLTKQEFANSQHQSGKRKRSSSWQTKYLAADVDQVYLTLALEMGMEEKRLQDLHRWRVELASQRFAYSDVVTIHELTLPCSLQQARNQTLPPMDRATQRHSSRRL